MSACSWILTWFAHSKGRVADIQYTLRIWDYLICSDSSSLVFLVTAILLRMFPEDIDLNMETIMEACQEAKDAFEFNADNTEAIIEEAERLRYKFCCKRQWVDEYNSLLLPGSKYSVKPISMFRMLSGLQRKPIIYSTLALVLVLYLISHLSSPTLKPWVEPIFGVFYAITYKMKDLVYPVFRK